jgi:hypothetical protein
MVALSLNPVILFEVRDMTETNNEDTGLTYVKPETVKHGMVDKIGCCSWGQDETGKWWSINYFGNRPSGNLNAEIRWDILPRDYAAFGIKSDLIDELNAIDAAEAKADLAEYQRQGALDRDGKPIHL